MEVKSFTYRRSLFGTYYKQGLLNLQKMDDHIAKMLSKGWEVLNADSAQLCTKSIETFRETRHDNGFFQKEVGIGSEQEGLLGMSLKDFVNIGRIAGNVGGPHAESAVAVDRSYPFSQELTFCLLFLVVLSLHFEY